MNTDYYNYYAAYEPIHEKSKSAATNAQSHPMMSNLGKDLNNIANILNKRNINLSFSSDNVYTTFNSNLATLAHAASNIQNYVSSIYTTAEGKYVTLSEKLDKLKELDGELKNKCDNPPVEPVASSYANDTVYKIDYAKYVISKKAWEISVRTIKSNCERCTLDIDQIIEYLSKVNSCDVLASIGTQELHMSMPSNPDGIDYSQIKADDYTPQGYTIINNTGTPMNNLILITAYSKNDENSKIYIYDAATGKLSGEMILTNKDHVGGTTYDPDNKILWVTGADGHAHSYDFEKMATVYTKAQAAGDPLTIIDFNDPNLAGNTGIEIPNSICTKIKSDVHGGFEAALGGFEATLGDLETSLESSLGVIAPVTGPVTGVIESVKTRLNTREKSCWEDGMDTITYHKGRLYSGSYSTGGILFETQYDVTVDPNTGQKTVNVTKSEPICDDLGGAVQGIEFYEDETGEYLVTCSSGKAFTRAYKKSRISKYPVIRNGTEVTIDNTRGYNNYYVEHDGAEGISIDSYGNISTVFEYGDFNVSTVCNIAEVNQPPDTVIDKSLRFKGDFWDYGHGTADDGGNV